MGFGSERSMSVKLLSHTRAFVIVFGVFNLIWGITLFFYYPNVPLTIVSPLIAQPIWAISFLLSGLLMLYGGIRQRPELSRWMMITGLFMKGMWEVGLGLRLNQGGGVALMEVWGALAGLQFFTLYYFRSVR